jgi:hypothetical protein
MESFAKPFQKNPLRQQQKFKWANHAAHSSSADKLQQRADFSRYFDVSVYA